jgi:hypothetical protein
VRVLVCGSRGWTDRESIRKAILSSGATIILQGEAIGADTIAKEIADELGIEVESYSADWGRYGRGAGLIRNQEMLDAGKPDLVLAFHLNNSRGTRDMIRRAREAEIDVIVRRGDK